ncbi:AAA family ATPase [Methylibium sp.]|uniref:AAA family ATPase n=1 Tax=Methylibium sp. TaxID=2067992 RepID=UPI00286B1A9A|nr:AAA family ATPase [Methylibium sp.]
MYQQFFGLKQAPFSIAPDPRYLFMSERHREALAHLLYGVGGGGGFVLLTGEIGAGKTTVCRCFLEQIPRRCNVAYIFNPKLTVAELLKSVCDEFHIPYEHRGPGVPTVKDHLDPLNKFLLDTHAVGQNNVLIIDEAQSLSADVLEQLRLLTNLETNERKLLQIVLIGQPELRTMLARPELEQLAQRVIARFHLEALSQAETVQYIRHRLAVAGMTGGHPFDRPAMRRVHHWTRGVPRRINLLCDRALLGAYATGKGDVGVEIVDKAAREVFDQAEPAARQRFGRRPMAVLGLGAALGGALLGVMLAAVNGGTPRESGALSAVAAVSALAADRAPTGRAPRASGVSPSGVMARSAAPSGAASASTAPASAASASADLNAAFDALIDDEKEAWRLLAAAWSLQLDDGDPCRLAQRRQVQCFRSSTSLALIRQLDRPGIVSLHGDQGRVAYALLTGLHGTNATLRAGGRTFDVPLASLVTLWRGDFATFWRAPEGWRSDIMGSGSAPVAEWLSTQLARAQGQPAPGRNEATEGALRSRIAAFQLAQGLKPDGLVGPMTLMQLNRASGVDEPRLDAQR